MTRKMRRLSRYHGFTLIELLIVVAIIAILAAIAVPNFLEAQTRSKVSRAKADIRAIGIGLEGYHVDTSRYPPMPEDLTERVIRLKRLTTPVAFLSSVPFEVFFKTTQDAYAYWSP